MIRRGKRRVGIGAWCRMRHATHPTMPCSSIAGGSDPMTQDHQWSSEIPGSRPSQIAWIVRRSVFPDRVFGNCKTNRTCAATEVADLAVHQRHNRLLLRMRHITIFQTIALFRNDKRHRHLPFSASFTPTTATSATPGWLEIFSSISRVPRRCPATLITCRCASKVDNPAASRMPQSKVAYTGRKQRPVSLTKRSSSPRWSEYSPAAAALPPPASLSR